MPAFLNSCLKAVIALTRLDEILREFAFSSKHHYSWRSSDALHESRGTKEFVGSSKVPSPCRHHVLRDGLCDRAVIAIWAEESFRLYLEEPVFGLNRGLS
jgi:hypothetical protein